MVVIVSKNNTYSGVMTVEEFTNFTYKNNIYPKTIYYNDKVYVVKSTKFNSTKLKQEIKLWQNKEA